MDIYLLRHADAFEVGKMGVTRDADRQLTERGIRKLNKVAKALVSMKLSFDAILSSPYRRAKETAEIVGDALDCRSLIKLTPNLVADGDPGALLREIIEDHARSRSILLVGHEPQLAGLASVLISGRHDASIRLRKGGLCKLSADVLRVGKCARLEWLIGPSQIFY